MDGILQRLMPDREAPLDEARTFAVHKRVLETMQPVVIAGLGYYLGTRIGFALTPRGQPNSAFWPPNAILLAALLLAPRRTWWILILAVLPAHMVAQLQVGVPPWTAAAWFVTNTGEALIGAFCIARFVPPTKVFESVRGVFIFVIFGVLIAPFATSFLDAAGVVLTNWGHGYLTLSAERFWTNALAELTIVPVIVLCSSNGGSWIKNVTLVRFCEAGLLGVSTAVGAFLVFGFEPFLPSATPVLLFLPMVLLMWATARFGSGGLSFCLLIISVTAIWFVMHGREPFPSASLRENVLSLQVLLCTVVLPLMFVAGFITDSRHTQASLRRLSANLINAQEQERARIGRELHDDINQRLAMLSVELERLGDTRSEVRSDVQELRGELRQISDDVQAISHDLHSSKLEYLGATEGMKSWCKEVADRHKIEVAFRSHCSGNLSLEIGLPLLRVLQEAVNNAIKHSGEKRIEVQLREDSSEIHLSVRDSGKGFDVESALLGKGMGLTSMRERVRLVNGTISIESKPMGGTTIRVRVPLGSEHGSQREAV